MQAFPDMQFQILEQSVQGEDQVYTSWQWTGTHRGPYHYKTDQGEYRDLAPSGVRVHVQGIAVDVCRDGKIIDLTLTLARTLTLTLPLTLTLTLTRTPEPEPLP